MFSTIVVGTDGSDTASAAVTLAVRLAQADGATLHLVSAFKDPATTVAVAHAGAVAIADSGTSTAAVKAACEELLAEVARRAEGVKVETHAVPGAPADVMVSVAEAVGADLIVVGSKGMRGARRIIGSVPNSVAHRAPCHVLVAKTT
ncbi:MAG TPA: universal stress protein [Acidimicrobiales bacterium]|nr:universal stress protein [Acidimicrobiales bacterium]